MSSFVLLLLLLPIDVSPSAGSSLPSVRWVDPSASTGLADLLDGPPVQAYRDPLTRRFRQPSPEEVTALRAATEAAVAERRRPLLEQALDGPAGGFRLELDDSFRRELRAVLGPGGMSLTCVGKARYPMSEAAPKGSAPGKDR